MNKKKTKKIIECILGNKTLFNSKMGVCNIETEERQVFPKSITRAGDLLIVEYSVNGIDKTYGFDLNEANEVVYRAYDNDVTIYFGDSDESMLTVPL